MKKIAIVLSGSGHQDGTEITEAVSTIITLSQLGAEIYFFAPNIDLEEVNHLTGKKTGLKKNLMQEAARIARGHVKDIRDLSAKDFDGMVFPGGMGAALNLSTFGEKGAQGQVEPQVKRVIEEFHRESLPIAAVCIAPTLLALVLGKHHVSITIGSDQETAQELEKTGAKHVNCSVDDFVTDRENKLVSTPAYMFGESKPNEVFKGISGCMKEFFEMA
ncbi:MAG: isoprenoid biosynthesis glyoxalase ElbB [Pseudomonadota bacterium]|nr:isoprenoid biosynthesis glyoxalase ElbB [Pseudomonadota bacterium]